MSAASAPHLLTRETHRARSADGVTFLGDLSLAPARVHEACGAARHTFALILAAALRGPVLWIAPAWRPERLHAEGVRRFVDPGRFLFVTPKRDEEVLWSMEETLRAGCVPLVVADLPAPPGLTPVRRLHLAAETGAAEGAVRPLGVLLTPGEGGAAGVETRWEMTPRHGPLGARAWALHRRRARMAPEKAWDVGIKGGRFELKGPLQSGTAPSEAAPGALAARQRPPV